MESLFGEQTSSLVPQQHADVLFDGPHDHERWDVRWRHEQVVIVRCRFEGRPESETPVDGTGEASTPRSQELFVVLTGFAFKPGDVAAIAIYTEQRDDALDRLASLGWHLLETPEE